MTAAIHNQNNNNMADSSPRLDPDDDGALGGSSYRPAGSVKFLSGLPRYGSNGDINVMLLNGGPGNDSYFRG